MIMRHIGVVPIRCFCSRAKTQRRQKCQKKKALRLGARNGIHLLVNFYDALTRIVKHEARKSMRILCIFIDGIGIGSDDPRHNPFAQVRSAILPLTEHQEKNLPERGVCLPTDACLDVPGLPQSATGQTALFTGVNAARQLGMHRSGFATPSLIEILRRESVFVKVRQAGRTAAFANAYGREFFELPDAKRAKITSVTTAATQTANLPFLRVEQIPEGRSLYHDFTNDALRKRGYDVPIFSPEFAGKQLATLARAYDFCLYEYFLTDKVGHFGSMELAVAEVEKLERFLTAVIEYADLRSTLVIVCSDHGNLEDVSVMTHTRNPVPTMIWGSVPPEERAALRSLTDVTPFMLRQLDA